jgi:hypothetical protein
MEWTRNKSAIKVQNSNANALFCVCKKILAMKELHFDEAFGFYTRVHRQRGLDEKVEMQMLSKMVWFQAVKSLKSLTIVLDLGVRFGILYQILYIIF